MSAIETVRAALVEDAWIGHEDILALTDIDRIAEVAVGAMGDAEARLAEVVRVLNGRHPMPHCAADGRIVANLLDRIRKAATP